MVKQTISELANKKIIRRLLLGSTLIVISFVADPEEVKVASQLALVRVNYARRKQQQLRRIVRKKKQKRNMKIK